MLAPKGKFWNLGSLKVHLLVIHISAQINRVCFQMSITAHKLCHLRLAQRVTAAGQLDVV